MTTNDFTERLVAEGESSRLEFRASVEPMDSIAKSVCAFLNTDGGTLIIGVGQDGMPNGSATEEQTQNLEKLLRESITPRVLYDVAFDRTANGSVIAVGVPAGPDGPYVYQGAVYIRKGAAIHPASASALRALVENSAQSTTRWERRAAVGLEIEGVDRALLDETVRRAQDRRGYLFDNPRDPTAALSQLALIQTGQLTNAADVLFGRKVASRHPQTRMRAVCFATDRADYFLDDQLFEGPAFKLLEDDMTFLKRHVPISSEFREGQLPRESKAKCSASPSLERFLVEAVIWGIHAGNLSFLWKSCRLDRSEL